MALSEDIDSSSDISQEDDTTSEEYDCDSDVEPYCPAFMTVLEYETINNILSLRENRIREEIEKLEDEYTETHNVLVFSYRSKWLMDLLDRNKFLF